MAAVSTIDLTPPDASGATLLERARRLADGFAGRAADYDRSCDCPIPLLDEVFGAGLLSLPIALDRGGWGGGLVTAQAVIAELARGEPATALIVTMHYANHAAIAQGRWPQAIGRRLADEAVKRRALVNAAQVEPRIGSPSHGGVPETLAVPTTGGWRLTGHKRYCTGAPALAWILVSASTREDTPRIGSFLVPAQSPGVEIVPTWNATGLRASASHDVRLTDVSIPYDHLIDARPADTPPARDALAAAWHFCLTASVYLGIASAARDWLVRFARTHHLATQGATLAEQPPFREGLGRIEVALATARRVLRSVADEADGGRIGRTDGPVARHIAIEQAIFVTSLALELAGNIGLSRDHPLERHHRDALCGRAHAPNGALIREMAAGAALAIT